MSKITSFIKVSVLVLVAFLCLGTTTSFAAGNLSGAAGAGTGAAGGQNTAITMPSKVVMDKETQGVTGDVLLAKPNDYMLDMMGGIIGGQAMGYVFANNGGATGKIFDGYQVKSGTPDITVFTYILGLLLQGIIVCAAILISWSYLLTSTATAQDGDFLGKKGDSSFLPFRTGGAVLGVAPIEAFGGLSLMQYVVVCAMSLGVVFAGYLSEGVINYTIDSAMTEMTSELKPQTVAPLVRQIMDTEVKCNFLSKDPVNKTIYNITPAPVMVYDSSDMSRTVVTSTSVGTDTGRNNKIISHRKKTEMCKVDYQSWMGPFASLMVNAYNPEYTTTFTSSYERSTATSNVGNMNNINDFIEEIAKEARVSQEVVKAHMHDLMDIVINDTNFQAFRKSVLTQVDARLASLQTVKGAAASAENPEDWKAKQEQDIALFDKAVVSITEQFNKQFFADYKTPEKIKKYAQKLKDSMNSEGFATLGGTVYGLLGVSTAIKKATDNAMPVVTKDKLLIDFGYDGKDKESQAILNMYAEYNRYYRSLYAGSAYRMQAAMKSTHGGSAQELAEDLKDSSTVAQTIVEGMGMDNWGNGPGEGSIMTGAPVMFALRNLGDNALGLAASLTVLQASAEAALSTTENGVTGAIAGFTGIGTILKAALILVIKMLTALIPYLFILGFILAFVIPALPWFFWVTAIVGLLIFFAEALIAINIWAIALAHPDGEGPTSQSSSQGLQLLIRLTFQPSVMVASFAFAMVAVDVVGKFVTTMTFSVLAGSMDSIFSFVGIMTLYMVILVSVTWTIYGVLSQMSAQVFSWIGQASHDMGEAKGEQNFMAAMNSSKQVSHAVGGVGGGAGAGADKATPGTPLGKLKGKE